MCNNPQVSWIRKRDLHILTSMSLTYTSDARFTVDSNAKTDDWNLRIDYVQPRDAGIYECQVNTEPKIYRAVTLKVLGKFLRGEVVRPRAFLPHKSRLKIFPSVYRAAVRTNCVLTLFTVHRRFVAISPTMRFAERALSEIK